VATWDQLSRIALALPEADERLSRAGNRQWRVQGKKMFLWERPLGKSDLRALGEAAPTGPILGVRVEHLIAKEAILASDPAVYFTIPHFDNFSAVLVRLPEIAVPELEELAAEAWMSVAPKRLAAAFLKERGLA
jgi:hypothetical protein